MWCTSQANVSEAISKKCNNEKMTNLPKDSSKMEASPTIFISAYRNFSVRYLLYSDVFKTLRETGARIVIFLKDNDLDYYRERLGGENIIFEPVLYESALAKLKKNHIQRLFVLIRKCMSGRQGEFKNTTDNVRFYQYGNKMTRTLIGAIEFWLVKGLAMLGRRFRVARRAIPALEGILFPGKEYDRYFTKYHPQMLIVSSIGYMIDPYFMRAARRHDCKVVSIIHNWDNPTTKDYRGVEPDHVIVWNDIMKREVNVFHDIPREKIHVGGIAHWDIYFNGRLKPRSKKEFLEAHGLSTDRKLIIYATSNFKLFRRTFDVIEELLDTIQNDGLPTLAQLMVRLHPGYLLRSPEKEGLIIDRYQSRIEELKAKYGSLVCFAPPMMQVLNDDIDMPVEDMHRLAEILYHSDVLLTEYSTVMIEATIFDLPVINVGLYNFRDTDKPASYLENYTHIRRILQAGASRNAYTFDELVQYLSNYLRNRSLDADKRRILMDQEITTNRGCAGSSIGKFLLSLLKLHDTNGVKSAR